MLKFGLFCLMVVGANAAFSSSAGASSGASTGNAYNTHGQKYPQQQNGQSGFFQGQPGYAGGYGGFPGVFPFQTYPQFPLAPFPYDYNSFLNNFAGGHGGGFGSSYAFSTPDATAQAQSNLATNNLYQQQQQQQHQQFAQNLNNRFGPEDGNSGNGAFVATGTSTGTGHQGSGTGFSGAGTSFSSSTGGYAPNFASASGVYGPGGSYQTASIYPTNPNNPNLDTRFGDNGPEVADVTYTGQPGVVGVSTSSFSSSSDINGQKQSHRGAVTSINDNGKVTTYRVQS